MTKKIKPFVARPARGQALLAYDRRVKPEVAVPPLFDAELMERAGEAADNFLLHSDCLPACAWLHSQGITVDLVYIDPPFASGANYARTMLLRGAKLEGKASIGEEVLYGDIWQKEDYLNWLYERLLAIREVMSERASIYVHLDWHIGHYAKVLLDEVFGEDNFRNDITWQKVNSNKAQSNAFGNQKDMLFYYTKSKGATFNEVYRTAGKTALDHYRHDDNDGRGKYRLVEIEAHGDQKYEGRKEVEFKGRTAAYLYSIDKLEEFDRQGLIYTSSTGRHSKKKYLSEMKGVLVSDIWTDSDVSPIQGAEKIGYPTQKPEALLRRIIEASSNKGDIVADFFCGSGTTAAAAHQLGRRFVACDIGLNGVQTSRDRLIKAGAGFNIVKVKTGLQLFRNPEQTEKLIMSLIPGWEEGEKAGIGDFWDGGIATGKGDYAPVKVIGIRQKLTMQIIGEVLTAAGQTGATTVTIIYAHKAPGVSQKEVGKEAKKHPRSDCAIVLKSFDELLGEKAGQLAAEDSAEISVQTTAAKNGKKACRIRIRRFFSPRLKAVIDEHNARLLEQGKKITADDAGLELIDCVQFDLHCGEVWQSDPALEDKAPSNKTIKADYAVPAAAFRVKIRNIAGDESLYACDGKTITKL